MPKNAQPQLPPLAWSLSLDEWLAVAQAADQPAFRARQLWQWLYGRRVRSWQEMSNLPASWRTTLAAAYSLSPWLATTVVEAPDGVRKFLLTCRDGEHIESVLIPAPRRLTLCVSTQAGCAFGCAFCASGQGGLARNLAAGEIVGQFMAAATLAAPQRITNVVLMGMGEPFDNYDAVLRAIRILNHPDGLAIGARRITLSSCGVVPGIARLAQEGLQVELSISLHAPDDALRSRLMPVNRRWPLPELLAACDDYSCITGRIVTYEYTLVAGVNDTPAQAAALAKLLRGRPGRVNLIPLSPVEGFDGSAPGTAACTAFAEQLRRAGINTTLRHSRGAAVAAACGQLRRAHRRQAGDACFF